MDIEKKEIQNDSEFEKIHDDQEKLYLILNTTRKTKDAKLDKKKKLKKYRMILYSMITITTTITILSLSIIGINPLILLLTLAVSFTYLYFEKDNEVDKN